MNLPELKIKLQTRIQTLKQNLKKIRLNKAKFWRFICIVLTVLLLITNTLLFNSTAYKRSEQLGELVPAGNTNLVNNAANNIGAPAIQIETDKYEAVTLVPLDTSSLTIDGLDDLDIQIHVSEEDVVALAKMIWGETRGVKGFTASSGRYVSNTEQIAACVWTVLNRVDAGYSDSIIKVITAKNQFTGYRSSNPVNPSFVAIARDCVIRWQLEKALEQQGISLDTGRVLPKPEGDNKWCWFNADGNGHNAFRATYKTTVKYDWSLSTPYEQDTVIDFNATVD